MLALLFAIMSAVSAELGGFLALSRQKKLNHILGFTAGSLIGLVAFGLLPEIFELTNSNNMDITWPMAALVTGYLLFHVVEKFILVHQSHEKDYTMHHHPYIGIAGASALIGHSLLDGISIGLAFQVNDSVGLAVAIAVIGHRFADGFNGVNLMIRHKNKRDTTMKVLALIAIAPIIGALSTLFYSFSETFLVIYLGFFAGFIVYIGSSDILPQAHSKDSSRITIGLTILGAVFIFGITRLA